MRGYEGSDVMRVVDVAQARKVVEDGTNLVGSGRSVLDNF